MMPPSRCWTAWIEPAGMTCPGTEVISCILVLPAQIRTPMTKAQATIIRCVSALGGPPSSRIAACPR